MCTNTHTHTLHTRYTHVTRTLQTRYVTHTLRYTPVTLHTRYVTHTRTRTHTHVTLHTHTIHTLVTHALHTRYITDAFSDASAAGAVVSNSVL